jgi:hypothetical protein
VNNSQVSEGGTRVELACPHQSGVLYFVPGTSSWVCTDEARPVHGLAGFFRELAELEDEQVAGLLIKWGIYFRPRSVKDNEGASDD